jgi:hypothetical protein
MLIGVDLVQEFCETIITTGRLVEPHPPVSGLIISHPEGGKTSIATNKSAKSIAVFTDITGRGIVELCKNRPELSHFIINDMVAIMAHRQTVNRYTQAMLNAVTEEGIQALGMPGNVEVIPNGRRGVIACMTMDIARDGRAWWNKIGFASRMVPFAYSHSKELTILIKEKIDAGNLRPPKRKKEEKVKELILPEQCVYVEFENKFVKQIRELADKKSKELGDPTGYRRLKQFRSLVCAHALRRTRKKPAVTKEDIEFINRIFPFVSYDNLNPI